ncbi:hypothetical protein Pcinc_005023 [Petrolisthes cinctipes]|uniref:Sushi domain-containing protein n=1 Tax=Petrolisthes cinctipes TaxID=88211 RepID=A0AAE1L361_PETCI|nr:hypothetical protein Pcinc_005023 [Petrolisthes cinctipes]
MRGLWGVLGRGLSLFLLLLVSRLTEQVVSSYERGKVYCYDEFDATIKTKVESYPQVADPITSYRGAKYTGSGTSFTASTCRDVTTVKTTLKVTDTDFVNNASDSSNVPTLEGIVMETFEEEFSSGTNTVIKDRLNKVHVKLDSTPTGSVLFTVQFVFKGHDDTLKDTVETEVTTVVLADEKLNDTWTVDTTGMPFTALKCAANPPATPANGAATTTNNFAGEMVTYTCNTGYRPGGAVSSVKSKCKDKGWTAISGLICEYNGCQHAPPQVVDNGEITWNNSTVNGTKVIYSCKTGFISTVNPDPEVMCLDQIWNSLPVGYNCLPNQFTNAEKEEEFYFMSVTIPSAAGLTLGILLCLCCSRPESPLCRCCSDKREGKNPSFA